VQPVGSEKSTNELLALGKQFGEKKRGKLDKNWEQEKKLV